MLKIDSKIEVCNCKENLLKLATKEEILEIYNNARLKSNQCACCDFVPKPNQRLKMHVVKINDSSLGESVVVLLCDICYYLKHFSLAVEKDIFCLVNSEFQQVPLIDFQRKFGNSDESGTGLAVKEKRISVLKLAPSDYFEQIQNDPMKVNPYIKVLVRSKFHDEFWKNCR